jgi:hypothetical protein
VFDFTILQYFQILNIELVPEVHVIPSQSLGRRLQAMPTLRKIGLIFPSPYDWDRPNPWGALRKNSDQEPWASTPPHPCVRTAIDWILTLAFPCIKDIPHIYLDGYVKSSLKAKWDGIFTRAYLHRDDVNYTAFDWDAAMAGIIGTPGNETPVCHCPLSCAHPPFESGEFDFNDEFDPGNTEKIILFRQHRRRWPKLFGPDKDDLSYLKVRTRAGWDGKAVGEQNQNFWARFPRTS